MTDLNQELKDAGFKITTARLKILKLLQNPKNSHISAEDIHLNLKKLGYEIGLATIYRILNQFVDAAIVNKHMFTKDRAVFELNSKKHHDHIVCVDCGYIKEFQDDEMQKKQMQIALENNMSLESHSLYLYASCNNKNCPLKKEKNAKRK